MEAVSQHQMMADVARADPQSKVFQGTGSKSKMPGEPWLGLLPCWDQGVVLIGFAGAQQPWKPAVPAGKPLLH